MEEKKYINIDNMATRLCQILKDARESMVDDKNKDFIMENFSDKHLEDKSNEMAWQFNSDMKKYLHNPGHRICGNFNNDDEIEEDFLNFSAGTLKIGVWHWFDERCPNNLHDDLMYPKNDAV
ncbi:hypothetical protein [Bacteroides acidifaciens]|uniref:hypothetical protein n=1 Tax=Bacteroides acidifaciens TaxID=85831 RepID=UPI00242BA7B8|nr:hypothetical protein [Bacteroides acidifaciens]